MSLLRLINRNNQSQVFSIKVIAIFSAKCYNRHGNY